MEMTDLNPLDAAARTMPSVRRSTGAAEAPEATRSIELSARSNPPRSSSIKEETDDCVRKA